MGKNKLSREDIAVSHFASLLRNVAASKTKLIENTVGANDKLNGIRDVFNSEWYFALSEFDQELEKAERSSSASPAKIAALLAALQLAWTKSLQDAMFRSFRRGYGDRGRQDSSTLTNEKIIDQNPVFKTMLDKQSAFANQFASQYASGFTDRKGAMGVGARTNMYGQALKGAYNAGAVFGGVGGERIFWRLGACDHCTDCPALSASSPFTRATLPTFPGNGDTICKTNCCCYLTFVRAPKEIEPDDTLASFNAEGGDVEEDTGRDTKKRELQDLMLQRAFLKRYAFGQSDMDPREVSSSQRDAASLKSKIDDLAASIGMSAVTKYNPGAVITRGDISYSDVRDIFDSGMDGPSFFRADTDRALASLDSVAREYPGAVERKSKVPSLKYDEDRMPKIGTFVTYNLVGNGAAPTYSILRSLVQVLSKSEIFVELGGLDDSMSNVVGFSGIWIRGQSDEVGAAIDLITEMGHEPMVAEVVLI